MNEVLEYNCQVPASDLAQPSAAHESMKRCTICGTLKPLSGYYMNRAKANGHDDYCRGCRLDYQHRRYRNKKRRQAALLSAKRAALSEAL